MNTEEKLKEIVATKLGLEVGQIRRESRFVEDLGADALDFIELIMDAEDEFDICILEGDVETITTFGKLVECVETSMQRQH